ncbi:DNA adenine methylase [Thermococcus sp. 2319x1]|uniref:DNA adenine methylase n=1 Tax=Thermococcus sp. 2319x1 TaxID=1674923 RepID=UPI001583A34B|nr:DNA adenine methylase [Thermococcus sp. 2319x1]
MVEPVLKWAGGKRQLLPQIMQLMPRDFKDRTFHEPFFGGGAVTFYIEPKSGTINDINPKLINFYVVLRDFVDELIEDAKQHKNEKEYYYRARAEFNRIVREGFEIPNIRLASLLLYLNKTAYNGLYRENKKGEFNVPFGRYKNPTIVDEKRLRQASKVLKNLKIYNTDFSYILDVAKAGDVVYFDPPYHPISETAKFTQYSKEDFSHEDQVRLRDVCLELHERGVFFILSNSYAPPVRKLYEEIKDFDVITVYAKRAINSKADRRGPVKEILVTNIPKESRIGTLKKVLYRPLPSFLV